MASDPEQVGATTTRTSGKRSSNVAAERVSATAAGTSTEGPGKKYRAGGKDAGGKQSATPRRALPGDDPLAPQRTRWLADAVGGSGALADMLGVSRSQTTRWASGQERPGVESAPLLIDLEHVLARVRLVWAEPAATTWMTSANAHLSGARPVDVLRTLGPGSVLEALDAGAWGGAA